MYVGGGGGVFTILREMGVHLKKEGINTLCTINRQGDSVTYQMLITTFDHSIFDSKVTRNLPTKLGPHAWSSI